ncbi:MAG TPA: hypothetical protein PKN61_00480 [Acidobacteriota bacterium]|jgi:hypothetical protein|nr:hypothetical protein [Acidobacteriota bacterium]HNR37486.1 hypothetical protein [Acidobacteriota bacterium]HNT99680.1 hypothetical protein [Acidobacteriota bacterium]HPB28577.1 hypothetical protein [Acidobacteriota bacterium]HQO25463.1 hypothetical protein [Acidobacteriota bacterium]
MIRSVLIAVVLLAATPAALVAQGPAEGSPPSLAELIDNLANAQHRGSFFRDRCVYFQRLYVERFKERTPEGVYENSIYQRLSVAEVSADKDREVIARLVSDTDGKLKPKAVSESSRNVFGAPRFLELLFFPLYPERKSLFEITDLGEAVIGDRKCRILRIYPHSDAEPLVEGVFYVDPVTGHPVRLVVDRLHHFELLDDNLDGLVELHAQVEYRTLPNGVTVPQACRADGNSRISRYKGFFKIDFLEWGYRPNPLYPDVVPYFEKMPDFNDPAPAAFRRPDTDATSPEQP